MISEITSSLSFKEIKNMTFYLGIDPTSTGITIGHMIPLKLAMDLMAKNNCKFIILIGGFTGAIGDPMDKMTARKKLDKSTVNEFESGILFDLKKILKPFEDKVTFVNNKDWLGTMSLQDFIFYTYAVSVNDQINMKTFKTRLENHLPLSLSEMIYPILQGIDHYYLYKNYGCTVQIGGQDQFGNIVFSVNLVKRLLKDQQIKEEELNKIIGISTCLLTSHGKKISKTDGGLVPFLNKPEDFYHYCHQMPDDTAQQISDLFDILETNPILQKLEIIKLFFSMYHGSIDGNILFEKIHEKVQKERSGSIENINESDILKTKFNQLSLILITDLNWVSSKTEFRQKLSEGAIKINNKLVDSDIILDKNQVYNLSFGKSKYKFIKIMDI